MSVFEDIGILPLAVVGVLTVLFLIWILFQGSNQRRSPFRIYVAGTMSGNKEEGIVDQGYRETISWALEETYEGLVIDDSLVGHEDSVTYNNSKARQAFNDCLRRAVLADMVIAYIPEASMGTALEIYEAHKRGVYVVVISPLTSNWIVRLYADFVYPSLSNFVEGVHNGDLNWIIFSDINDFDGVRTYRRPKE